MTLIKIEKEGEKNKRKMKQPGKYEKKVGHSNTVFTAVNIHCQGVGTGPDLHFFLLSLLPYPSPRKILLLLARFCPPSLSPPRFLSFIHNVHSFFNNNKGISKKRNKSTDWKIFSTLSNNSSFSGLSIWIIQISLARVEPQRAISSR